MNLIISIPYDTASWHRSEALIDWHRELNGQRKTGHLLLVAATDAHAEIRLKMKIAAELAFESVTEFQIPKAAGLDAPQESPLYATAKFIGLSCRWPWLWCTHTCVPLVPHWIEALTVDYESQPMRYMGKFAKVGENIIMAPNAIYSTGAINDFNAKRNLLPLARETRLIQVGSFTGEDLLTNIRNDAVLFCGAKDDSLMNKLEARMGQTVRQSVSMAMINEAAKALTPIGKMDMTKPPNSLAAHSITAGDGVREALVEAARKRQSSKQAVPQPA